MIARTAEAFHTARVPGLAEGPELALRATFAYVFGKCKKGLLVQYRQGILVRFVPFDNEQFENEFSYHLLAPPPYGKDVVSYVQQLQKGRVPQPILSDPRRWYANGGLIRFEVVDTLAPHNLGALESMLRALTGVPDCDWFVNRRDFPLVTRAGPFEPYDQWWGEHPVVSHADVADHGRCVVASMCTSPRFRDLAMPTYEDWTRVLFNENPSGPEFADSRRGRTLVVEFDTVPWSRRAARAVFRGASTGLGVTREDNMRLKAAHLSVAHPRELDAGITQWNTRPRKRAGVPALATIRPRMHPPLRPYQSLVDQARGAKYLLHLDGHTAAHRLSLELRSGSVVLLPDSPWRLWFQPWLVPFVHYVPVRQDLGDLIARIEWCRAHDSDCEAIVNRARRFYDTFLTRDGCLSYLRGVARLAALGDVLVCPAAVLDHAWHHKGRVEEATWELLSTAFEAPWRSWIEFSRVQ